MSELVFDELLTPLASHPQVRQVALYGSRARGEHRPYSDIDVVYFGDVDRDGELAIWCAVDDAPIIYGIDLVHYESPGTSDDLRAEIDRDGVVIFKREDG